MKDLSLVQLASEFAMVRRGDRSAKSQIIEKFLDDIEKAEDDPKKMELAECMFSCLGGACRSLLNNSKFRTIVKAKLIELRDNGHEIFASIHLQNLFPGEV